MHFSHSQRCARRFLWYRLYNCTLDSPGANDDIHYNCSVHLYVLECDSRTDLGSFQSSQRQCLRAPRLGQMDQLSADTPAAAYLAQHQVSQLLELGLEAMLKAYNPESGGLPSGRESRAPSSCSTHSPHHLLRTRRPSSRGPSQPHSHHD